MLIEILLVCCIVGSGRGPIRYSINDKRLYHSFESLRERSLVVEVELLSLWEAAVAFLVCGCGFSVLYSVLVLVVYCARTDRSTPYSTSEYISFLHTESPTANEHSNTKGKTKRDGISRNIKALVDLPLF